MTRTCHCCGLDLAGTGWGHTVTVAGVTRWYCNTGDGCALRAARLGR